MESICTCVIALYAYLLHYISVPLTLLQLSVGEASTPKQAR